MVFLLLSLGLIVISQVPSSFSSKNLKTLPVQSYKHFLNLLPKSMVRSVLAVLYKSGTNFCLPWVFTAMIDYHEYEQPREERVNLSLQFTIYHREKTGMEPGGRN